MARFQEPVILPQNRNRTGSGPVPNEPEYQLKYMLHVSNITLNYSSTIPQGITRLMDILLGLMMEGKVFLAKIQTKIERTLGKLREPVPIYEKRGPNL